MLFKHIKECAKTKTKDTNYPVNPLGINYSFGGAGGLQLRPPAPFKRNHKIYNNTISNYSNNTQKTSTL